MNKLECYPLCSTTRKEIGLGVLCGYLYIIRTAIANYRHDYCHTDIDRNACCIYLLCASHSDCGKPNIPCFMKGKLKIHKQYYYQNNIIQMILFVYVFNVFSLLECDSFLAWEILEKST